MTDSRRISGVLTQDVNGQEVIVYRGEVYAKRTVRTRMANAGKHCVSEFNFLIDSDQNVISAIPDIVTPSMISNGTIMSELTAERYCSDIKRMCSGRKTKHIPESRIRQYAWDENAFALLKAFDEA